MFSEFHDPFSLWFGNGAHKSPDWNHFSSPPYGIEFDYPPALTVRIVGHSPDERHQQFCDSSIQLVAPLIVHISDDSTVETTAPVIEILFTRESFTEFATEENFEYGPLLNPWAPEEDSAIIKDTAHYCWISMGRQGLQNEASLLDGPSWKGLRGENLTGTYSRSPHGGGYQGMVPFVKTWLLRSRGDSCNVVMKYYDGPVSDVEDEFQNDVTEGEFYYVVASTRILKR